jgi:hypothetical protein
MILLCILPILALTVDIDGLYRQINTNTQQPIHLGQFVNDQITNKRGIVYDETGLDGLDEEKLQPGTIER